MKIDIDLSGLNDLIQWLEDVPRRLEGVAARALNRAGDQALLPTHARGF